MKDSKLKIIAPAFLILNFEFLIAVSHAEPLSENQARFGVITGDVGLLAQGADHWIVPHEGLPIEPGDHIRTGEDGTVEIVPSAHALWILQPGTDGVVEHNDVNAGRVDLSSGSLLGKVDSRRTVGTVQRWEFDTPAAVLAVRGGDFAITVTHDDGTRLGVFEGSVDMEPAETAEGPAPPQEVLAGHEASARRGKAVQVLARLSPRLAALSALRPVLHVRQTQIEDTWSPLTPTVRAELRRAYVAAPPKHSYVRRAPARPRHRPSTGIQ
jgi:hypothetical protein